MLQDKAFSISVVVPTYNSEKTLSACLQSIESQNYNSKLIEVIIVDGGSIDSTLRIAKKYRTKIINVPKSRQNAEYNKYFGFSNSKGDLVLMLDSDNILTHRDWLSRMVKPFKSEKNLVGSDTVYIHYKKSLSVIDRYLALFGSLDPVAFYLGKSDKMPRFDDKYSFFKNAQDKLPHASNTS